MISLDFFKDIFGRVVVVKTPAEEVKPEESPIEYKTTICNHFNHSWESSITIYPKHINTTEYNEFLDSVGCKKSTYHQINILEFRMCNKCHTIQVKSNYENLYGPDSWTNSNDILEKLMIKYSNIEGLPAPDDFGGKCYRM